MALLTTSSICICLNSLTRLHHLRHEQSKITRSVGAFNPSRGDCFLLYRCDSSSMRSLSKMVYQQSRDVRVHNNILPVPGDPIDPSGAASSGSWTGWILGMMLTIIIPFWTSKDKWGPLLQLKRRVEEAVQTVEDVTEAVEKVTDKVEELAEDIAEKLPAGKLKDTVSLVEKVAERISHDAHLADEVIDKLQEKDKEMETFIVDIVDRANDISKDVKQISHDANEVSKEAKEIAKEVKQFSNDLNKVLKGTNEISQEVKQISDDTNEVSKGANEIIKEVKQISKDVNEISDKV